MNFTKNKKLSFFLIFLLLSAFSLAIDKSPSFGMNVEEEKNRVFPQMKFKLGFEFQEGSGLCPWAIEDSRVQKKLLFSFNTNEKKLWHVEIDTSDIEFVTIPFTEIKLLSKSIKYVQVSLKKLQEIFQKTEKTTFHDWVENINSNLNKGKFEIKFSEDPNFLKLLKEIIRPRQDWEPIFSPQATIQHPLEHTIPLYFSLFGFDETNEMLPLKASLPYLDMFKEREHKKFLLSQYITKAYGLAFVNALTVFEMTSKCEEDDTDSVLLDLTQTHLDEYNQIDAKFLLTFMSRRPFSSMLKDHPIEEYAAFFQHVTEKNKWFFQAFEVPLLFYKSNYAQQVFDKETGKPIPLNNLLLHFKEEFLENNEVLKNLLSKGVFSTTMLRNIKLDSDKHGIMGLLNKKKEYYEKIIESVVKPKERFSIDHEDFIQKIDWNHDGLSPPLLLDDKDSMGFLRNDDDHDKNHGEAIVEFREIKNVGTYFLKKMDIEEGNAGTFLKHPERVLEESIKLFKFLETFGEEKDKQAIMNFIYYISK